MMRAVLDLTHYHFKRTLKGLTLFGTWIDSGNGHRPCLVLIRAGEEYHDDTMPCIVTVDKAYLFDEHVGDPAECAKMIAGFLQALRMDGGRNDVRRLFWLIHDHLSDLMTIPPYSPPQQQESVVGHISLSDRQTGETHQMEIKTSDV